MSVVGTICQNSFQWKIPNFFDLNVNRGDCIKSPQFTLIGKEGIQKMFHLDLYPKGDEDADWVEIYLIPDDSLNSCTVSYKMGILGKEENLIIQIIQLKDYTFLEQNDGWGSRKFVKIQKLKSQHDIVLPNGTLTVLFESEGVQDKPKDPTMSLVDDLEKLSTNDDFTDIEIHCKDIKIKSHKAILGSRSSVFKAMFTNQCKESQTGCVKIDNMEPKVLKDLISFIYSGKVKKLEENVADLFIVADMYMIESLTDVCGTYMMNNLTNENAISYLILADSHNCKMLKEAAMDYIVQNIADFMEKPEMKKVSHELVMDIMKGVVKQNNNIDHQDPFQGGWMEYTGYRQYLSSASGAIMELASNAASSVQSVASNTYQNMAESLQSHCASVAERLMNYKYQDRSLLDTSPLFPDTNQPVYILGEKWSAQSQLEELRHLVQSRIWFTYRVGGVCSDVVKCSWPPVLWIFTSQGIYHIIKGVISLMGESVENKPVGTWFGPNTVLQVMRKLTRMDPCNDLVIHVAMDNTLIVSEAKRASLVSDKEGQEDSWRSLLLCVTLRNKYEHSTFLLY